MHLTSWLQPLLLTVIVLAASPLLSTAQRPGERAKQADVSPAEFAGCYELTSGYWSQPIRSGPPAPPSAIRLDTIPRGTARSGHRFIARVPDPTRSARWTPMGSDSLEVVTWLDRLEGEVLYLRREGDMLRGVARRTTDAIPVDSTGRVLWEVWPAAVIEARRVRCSTVKLEPAA